MYSSIKALIKKFYADEFISYAYVLKEIYNISNLLYDM